MTEKTNLIQIGVIIAAHGIRGQVKIKHFLDNPKSVLSKAQIVSADGKKSFKLTLHTVTPDMLIASIEGITDRNAAELLKRTELFIAKSELPESEDGSWYYNDLIGLAAKLNDGKPYGKVIALENFGAGDIVEIQKPDGSTEMLPFNDTFVSEVDTKSGFIVVIPPEYTGEEQRDE